MTQLGLKVEGLQVFFNAVSALCQSTSGDPIGLPRRSQYQYANAETASWLGVSVVGTSLIIRIFPAMHRICISPM